MKVALIAWILMPFDMYRQLTANEYANPWHNDATQPFGVTREAPTLRWTNGFACAMNEGGP